MSVVTVTNPIIMARMSVATDQAGDEWTARLMRAPLRGEASVTFVQRGEKVPALALNLDTRLCPLVIVLAGDVPGQPNPGPDEFPSVWRAFQWSAAIVFHAAAGTAEHADEVLRAAVVVRKVLVVETGTAALPAWLDARNRYAPARRSLVIKPRDGLPHPIHTAPVGTVLQ
jgi:hypothetical protein